MANLYWRRSWLLFKSKKADAKNLYPHDRDQAYKLGRGKITVWQLQFDKAKQARSRGDLKKAELIYKTLVDYDESDLKAWFALAQLYEHMGEPELAKAAHLRLDEFNSG
jgi:Tfp pilus assembly protein PilF